MFNVGAVTISSVREFQGLNILRLKQFCLSMDSPVFFFSFNECPLVVGFCANSRMFSTSASYRPANSLYVSMISPLSLLKRRVGRPSLLSRYVYGSSFRLGIWLVARLWTPSSRPLSFL